MLVAKTIFFPSLFYGVEIFGHCDTQDTQKFTDACNSIVPYVFNLRRTELTSEKIVSTREPCYLFLKLKLKNWLALLYNMHILW